jgi:hypothetical protein
MGVLSFAEFPQLEDVLCNLSGCCPGLGNFCQGSCQLFSRGPGAIRLGKFLWAPVKLGRLSRLHLQQRLPSTSTTPLGCARFLRRIVHIIRSCETLGSPSAAIGCSAAKLSSTRHFSLAFYPGPITEGDKLAFAGASFIKFGLDSVKRSTVPACAHLICVLWGLV